MGALSPYLAAKLVDHALGVAAFTPASTLEVRLYNGSTEITGTGYAPVSLTNNATNFPACAVDSNPIVTKKNGTLIQFPTSVAAWGDITHWAIWGDGNLYCTGAIDPTNYVNSGFDAKFAIGKLSISLTAESPYPGYETYRGFDADIRRRMLDLAFGKATYTSPAAVYLEFDGDWIEVAFDAAAVSEGVVTTQNSGTVVCTASATSVISITGFAISESNSTYLPVCTGVRAPGTYLSTVIGQPFSYAAGDLVVKLQ